MPRPWSAAIPKMLLLATISLCPFITIMVSHSEKVKWVFIAYHKTGHVFSHIISNIFEKCNAQIFSDSGRFNREQDIFNLQEDIAVFTGLEYQVDWLNRTRDGSALRYAHFVRDPFDAILSGYLYHSQIPAPEPWELTPREVSFICRHTNINKKQNETWEDDVFQLYREPFGRYINNITRIDELFRDVMKLCKSLSRRQEAALKRRYKQNGRSASKVYNFNEILHAQRGDEFDNIRYMALWFLLFNGDLLRMAANAMYSNPITSRQIFISDFPIGNKTVFRQSATKLYEFLMGRGHNKFWSCMEPIEKAVSVTIKEDFVASSTPAVDDKTSDGDNKKDSEEEHKISDHDVDDDAIINQKARGNGNDMEDGEKSSHISVGRMTPTQRQVYIDRLKRDPTVGPILSIVQSILLDRKRLELS